MYLFNFQSDFVGRDALLEAMKLVPTRSTVHLQISPEILNLEPEGDETVICEGKPVGQIIISKNKIFFKHLISFFLYFFFYIFLDKFYEWFCNCRIHDIRLLESYSKLRSMHGFSTLPLLSSRHSASCSTWRQSLLSYGTSRYTGFTSI